MYKTINGWTKQKMIDHVIQNFKGKSMNTSGSCKYRGPDGKKCAVGMFIPNSFYKEDMDNCYGTYQSVLFAYPKLLDFMPIEKGCREMQFVHDTGDMNSGHPEDTRTDEEVLSDILNFIYAEVED